MTEKPRDPETGQFISEDEAASQDSKEQDEQLELEEDADDSSADEEGEEDE